VATVEAQRAVVVLEGPQPQPFGEPLLGDLDEATAEPVPGVRPVEVEVTELVGSHQGQEADQPPVEDRDVDLETGQQDVAHERQHGLARVGDHGDRRHRLLPHAPEQLGQLGRVVGSGTTDGGLGCGRGHAS
jgi:hypothetical protein